MPDVRLCLWCRASIEHKRPQARYCGEPCRVMFTRAGRAKLTTAQRSRCVECIAFGRKCYRHAIKPARGRVDTTFAHPAFWPPGLTYFGAPRPPLKSHKERVDDHFRSEAAAARSDVFDALLSAQRGNGKSAEAEAIPALEEWLRSKREALD